MTKEELKNKLVAFLTYKPDTQFHINLAMYGNWVIMVAYLMGNATIALIVASIIGVLLIVWEIIFWKNAIGDSIKDVLVAVILMLPLVTAIIKNS